MCGPAVNAWLVELVLAWQLTQHVAALKVTQADLSGRAAQASSWFVGWTLKKERMLRGFPPWRAPHTYRTLGLLFLLHRRRDRLSVLYIALVAADCPAAAGHPPGACGPKQLHRLVVGGCAARFLSRRKGQVSSGGGGHVVSVLITIAIASLPSLLCSRGDAWRLEGRCHQLGQAPS